MPAVLPITIILSALALWLTLYGMQTGYQYSVGALLRFIVTMLENLKIDVWRVSINVGDFLAKYVKSIDHAMQKALGDALNATAAPVVRFLHWSAVLVTGLGNTIGLGARETAWALNHLRRSVIPHALIAAKATALRLTHALRAEVVGAQKAIRQSVAAVHHAIAVTLPHEIAGVGKRVGHLEKWVQGQRSILKNLEKLLAAGGIAALVLAGLKALKLQWLRCNNTSRFGKRICQVDSSWVDDFLSTTLLIVGTTSFVEFVKEAQQGYGLGLDGLKLIIRELDTFDILGS